MWLLLYGRQAVQHKLKKGLKMQFLCLYTFFDLTDSLTTILVEHINAFCMNLSYSPKDQSLKFSRKNIENWRSWKMTFFWFLVPGYWGFQNFCFLFFPNENQGGFHMRYHLFLHYGWFFRIIEKT